MPADQKNGKVLVWLEGVQTGEGSGRVRVAGVRHERRARGYGDWDWLSL